jgi:N-acetyl-gamma-glutamylphosphate reductase
MNPDFTLYARPTARSASTPAVAIVGATGAVGVELLRCLEHRVFPLALLRLLDAALVAGTYRADANSLRTLSPLYRHCCRRMNTARVKGE